MYKNGYLVYLKCRDKSSQKKDHKHLNISTEDLWLKTLIILAMGAEEEDVEQEDMAYTASSLSLP